jgi:hypothetical protein
MDSAAGSGAGVGQQVSPGGQQSAAPESEQPVQPSVPVVGQQGAVSPDAAVAGSGWQPGTQPNWADLFGQGGGAGESVSQPVEQWLFAPVEQLPVQSGQPSSFGGDSSGSYYG